MARALRRAGLTLALPALVGASTVLHWLAGRRLTGLWIMPDEAIYAGRAIGLWRHFSLPVLHGAGAGYSILYPVVAGLPLAVGSLSRGYASLKLFQALVVSLSAVPVFAYGRRTMPPGYAYLAAALAVSSPLLLYSGLVMTEVLYYPLAALALLAIARAVETATRRDQVIALVWIAASVLTRVQAIVFLPVFAAGILVDAALARDRSRLRAFWPIWALFAVAAVVAAASPGLFGAYAGTLSGGYPLGGSLRFVYYHFAYVALMVSVAPVAALAILGVEAIRGRVSDPAARALVAVTLCATVLVVLQVGLFAARYAPHLLGRDLSALPPVLSLVFALWLARGSPRPAVVASVVVLAVGALVLAAPWDDLVAANALPDTMGLASFLGRSGASPATEIAIGVAAGLVLVRFAPRRLALVLPALVLATLVATSVSASNLVSAKVRFDQAAMLGTPRDWIQQTVRKPVAYLYNGDAASWNVVWQQRFWNPRIVEAVSLRPFVVPGPLPSRVVDAPPDGRLGIPERYVVANDRDVLVGTPVAHQNRGTEQYGLTLWHVTPPARISTITYGVKPNGDIIGSASLTAYDCRGGELQMTLLPKATDTLDVTLDGKQALQAHIGGRDYWNGTVPVPAGHTSNICHFSISGGLLLGSTRLAFVR
jgi:hypothetical protein